jgi:ubiquitin C-terminal hydrolase
MGDQNQEKKDIKMRGIIGLANLGNTCYMNAAIQALRHCPEWTLFCTKGTVDEHVTEKETPNNHVKLLYAYKDLIKSLWAGTGPAYVMPRGFYDQLKQIVRGTIYDVFTQRTPQDAHEFLTWILDQMYMATQKKIDFPYYPQEDSMKEQALKAWKENFEKQYSPLTDLIFGLHRIQYKCHNCQGIQTRWETFNTLKISPKQESWTTCIEQEFQEEDIDDYNCESCKGKHKVTKTIKVWKLPKVLILTVKRFTPFGTKENTPTQYDGSPLEFSSIFAEESKETSKHKKYKVFGTVDHHGSAGGGHYTAQCLNPVWNVWHMYDDESAHPIPGPKFGSHTYMMFFRLS